ncbi:MAG: hypothetical protein FJ029_03445 [Actinobacteria bacterium]|nr:hypothetical protein [Actinomycetota bacterium]
MRELFETELILEVRRVELLRMDALRQGGDPSVDVRAQAGRFGMREETAPFSIPVLAVGGGSLRAYGRRDRPPRDFSAGHAAPEAACCPDCGTLPRYPRMRATPSHRRNGGYSDQPSLGLRRNDAGEDRASG